MIAHSVRDALREAERRGCTCEAVTARTLISRAAATRGVPTGGLLVKDNAGKFIALRLVPKETS